MRILILAAFLLLAACAADRGHVIIYRDWNGRPITTEELLGVDDSDLAVGGGKIIHVPKPAPVSSKRRTRGRRSV